MHYATHLNRARVKYHCNRSTCCFANDVTTIITTTTFTIPRFAHKHD